ANADLVTDLELLPRRHVAPAGSDRQGERKAPLGAAFELFLGNNSLLDAERGEAGQRALVVAGQEIVARLHSLHGMAIFVHVEDAELDRKRVQRVDAFLPRLVERLRLQGVTDAAETLPATHVMHAVHGAS